jgi:hypothetical protein
LPGLLLVGLTLHRLLLAVAIAALLATGLPHATAASENSSITGAFLYGNATSRFLKNTFRSLDPVTYTFEDHYPSVERAFIQATPSDPGGRWSIVLAAPSGEALAVGTYTNARHALAPRASGVPGIALSGEGAGCSEYRGEFTVDELERDAAGNLARFSASFAVSCEDYLVGGLTHGVVRFHSTRSWAGWKYSLGPYSAFAFGSVVVDQQSAAREVAVTNNGAEPITVSASLLGNDAPEFSIVDAANCLGQLEPAEECRFVVLFEPTAKGSRAAQLDIVSSVHGTRKLVNLTGTGVHVSPTLTVQAHPNPAYVGDMVTITVTADPVPDGGTIYLNQGSSENLINQLVGSKPIGGANGSSVTFSTSFAQNEGLVLMASFPGTATYDYSESAVFQRSQKHPPETWITNQPNVWSSSSVGHFAFSSINNGFYTPALAFECRLDAGTWQTCSSPHATSPLGDGPHTLSIRGIDANGRVEPNPESVTWRVDTSAPTLSVKINDGAVYTNSSVARIDVAATDQHRVDQIVIALDGSVDEHGHPSDPKRSDFPHRATYDWDFTLDFRGGTTASGPRTIYIWACDPLGNWTDPLPVSFIYDKAPPTTVQPTVDIPTGKWSTGFPVRVRWPAASDALSGIDGYDLQRKVGANPYHTVNAGASAATSISQSLKKGTSYRYRLRSIDRAGNASAWSSELSFRTAVRQEASTKVQRSSGWKRKSLAGAAGGSVLRSGKAGATVKTTFTGHAIAWVSTTGPSMGQARVYVDGGALPVATVDLHRSSRSARQVVWSMAFANGGKHTVEIRVVGTSGRPSVDLDAFLVLVKP